MPSVPRTAVATPRLKFFGFEGVDFAVKTNSIDISVVLAHAGTLGVCVPEIVDLPRNLGARVREDDENCWRASTVRNPPYDTRSTPPTSGT